MYSLGAELSVDVCRSTSSTVTPFCIYVSPTGDKPWYLHRGKLATIYISNLPLGVTNEGREAIAHGEDPIYKVSPPSTHVATREPYLTTATENTQRNSRMPPHATSSPP